jgi:ATP diphosphatase
MADSGYEIADLLRVMERLRDPETGCPWDLRQDFHSIVPSTLEECYELAQAIEHEDFPHVAEELGDVLFQVVFYAQMGREQGFSFDRIVHTLVEKLVRRHPHVFADGAIEGVVEHASSVDEVKESWESIKQGEREARLQSGALADVPVTLPALPSARPAQGAEVAKTGCPPQFRLAGCRCRAGKARGGNLRVARSDGAGSRRCHLRRDGRCALYLRSRHLGLDAEANLRHASSRFERRFSAMEEAAKVEGHSLDALDSAQLDDLWEAAKRRDN